MDSSFTLTPRFSIKMLEKALRLYTPSLAEKPMAEFLADKCDDLGFDNIKIDEVGNLIATIGSGSPRVLLCGHMDTVPGKVKVRKEGDFLYGRGASDAKAPLMAMLLAASTLQKNAATASPVKINTQAPALSGPVEFKAPVGTLAGPRQVVTGGNTVGIADPTALGTGSSVREGIDSNRDVHGAKTGERASVNVAVGAGGGRGTGGEGTGPGGVSFDECMRRAEVQAYLARLKERVLARWRGTPSGLAAGAFKATLGFRLDPSGSASEVELVSSQDPGVGRSAADAMRAASPFDLMGPQVRCLAGNRFTATFLLENN